jgi:hypothetical protein
VSIVAMMTSRKSAVPADARRRWSRHDAPVAATQQQLEKLTRYIPTEAIALYVAVLPFLVPKDVALVDQDFTSRWCLAIGVCGAAVLFAVGVYRRDVFSRGEDFRWPLRKTIIVGLAYWAWVFAIPASPLNAFDWYSPSLGAIVGIVTSAVIALFELWFGPAET